MYIYIFTSRKKRFNRGDAETGHKTAAKELDTTPRFSEENSDTLGDFLFI